MDADDFIFTSVLTGENEKKRAHDLCVRIRNRIANSKVLVKNPNYQYTTHMFRKTKAYNVYNQGLTQLKEQARQAIGQSTNSQAIEHYIYLERH